MPKRETLNEAYFNWLYDAVDLKRRNISHRNLCRLLHDKQFRWFVANDDNRCDDGLQLRDYYIQEQELDTDHLEVVSFLERGCSVFEVFVAIAGRMNDLQYSLEDHKNYTPKWFHELLHNLQIEDCIDNPDHMHRLDPVEEARVDDVIEILLDRTYDFFGNGSLFPMKKRPLHDMRNVEIWYQMMAYLAENYT